MQYPAQITQDPEGLDWVVKFRDLKGTNTGGATPDEALAEAADCLGSHLAALMATREPIPAPSQAQGDEILIAVPDWAARRLRRYKL